jgi:hypothetical protein
MDQRKTERVLFLGEQDGAAEQALKQALAECFSLRGDVLAAYLARVSFWETPGPQVALCIRGTGDISGDLVECAGKIFSGLFKTSEHLDILFLSEAQVLEISSVARPFYPPTDQSP